MEKTKRIARKKIFLKLFSAWLFFKTLSFPINGTSSIPPEK